DGAGGHAIGAAKQILQPGSLAEVFGVGAELVGEQLRVTTGGERRRFGGSGVWYGRSVSELRPWSGFDTLVDGLIAAGAGAGDCGAVGGRDSDGPQLVDWGLDRRLRAGRRGPCTLRPDAKRPSSD